MLETLGLDDVGIRVFRAVARHPGGVVETLAEWTGLPTGIVAEEVHHQRDLGLLHPAGPGWVARDPVMVLAEAHASRDARTAAQRETMRDERAALARSGLFADYLAGRRRPGTHDGVVDVLRGDQIWARLAELAETARGDLRFLLDATPTGGGGPGELAEAVLRATRRGVRVGAVWTRDALVTTSARQPVVLPAWARQCDHLPMRALVTDGATAVVPVDPTNLHRGAFVVVAPELVAVISQLVDDLYAASTPRATGGAVTETGPRGRHERDLVRLLTAGYDDGTIAGRLGVHPTTVQHDIAALMTRHGARTRFALGAALVDAGLIPGP